MAGTSTGKPDPRTPNTTADRDPRAFGTIDATGAEEAALAGPGVLPPLRVESSVTRANSTFAERAAARRGGGNKAVQSGENK